MASISTFKGERFCPRDGSHDPHDEGAFFCWFCGIELLCDECGRQIFEHEFREPKCPLVFVQLSA